MESAGAVLPQSTALDEIPSVPIASLDPARPPPSNTSINAVVSLVWPYSSSHRTFALLLAEPDFRLRRNRGQIRVQLKGSIAETLAGARVGIGDSIRLSLAGSQWVEDAATVKTPGRSVDADLLFRSKILLQITRDGDPQPVLSLDGAESPAPQAPSRDIATPQEARSPVLETPKAADLSRSWRTPARLYSSLEIDHPVSSDSYDLVEDEDVLDDRPTKRAKFERGRGHWRLVDRNSRSPEADVLVSPIHSLSRLDGPSDYRDITLSSSAFDTLTENGLAEDELEATVPSLAVQAPLEHSPTTPGRMGPPEIPKLQTVFDAAPSQPTQTFDGNLFPPSTPSLEPIPSAVLPQVSPFTSFQESYFPQQVAESSGRRVSDIETVQQSSPDSSSVQQPGRDEIAEPSLAIENERAQPGQTGQLETGSEIAAYSSEPILERGGDGIALSLPPEPLTVDFETDGRFNVVAPEDPLQSHGWDTLSQDFISYDPEMQPLDFTIVNAPNAADLLIDRGPNFPVAMEANQSGIGTEVATEEITPILVPGAHVRDPQSELVGPSEYYDQVEDLYSRPEPASEPPQPLMVGEELSQTTNVDRRTTSTHVSEPLTPEASQETTSKPRRTALLGHRVDEILDGRLPPTPQLSELPPNMIEPVETSSYAREPQEDDQATKLLRSSRRSSSVRTTEVPNAISAWFTARRQSTTLPHENGEHIDPKGRETSSKEQQQPNSAVGFDFGSASRDQQTKTRDKMPKSPKSEVPSDIPVGGLRTPLSYYSPISSLDRHVNGFSQVGENLVDVIVVANSATARPERAKSGPKDFFTYLTIADSLSFPESLQVQIFRPFKSSLPKADAGDVILFRNFSVKSRKGQCFLLSGESSAWHVWRYGQAAQISSTEDLPPIWARRTQKGLDASDEECNGPPVEIGPEERQYALALRHWWESLEHKGPLDNKDMTNGHDASVVGSAQSVPSSEGIAVGI